MNRRIKKKIAIRKCRQGLKDLIYALYPTNVPEMIDGLEIMFTYRMARIKNWGKFLPLSTSRNAKLERQRQEVKELIQCCEKQYEQQRRKEELPQLQT